MTGVVRTISTRFALAAVLFATPLAHLVHAHNEQGCCQCVAEKLCPYGHDHRDCDPAKPDRGKQEAPAGHHDCPICQFLAMSSIPQAFSAVEISSDLCWRNTTPVSFLSTQAIRLAYHERGPPHELVADHRDERLRRSTPRFSTGDLEVSA